MPSSGGVRAPPSDMAMNSQKLDSVTDFEPGVVLSHSQGLKLVDCTSVSRINPIEEPLPSIMTLVTAVQSRWLSIWSPRRNHARPVLQNRYVTGSLMTGFAVGSRTGIGYRNATFGSATCRNSVSLLPSKGSRYQPGGSAFVSSLEIDFYRFEELETSLFCASFPSPQYHTTLESTSETGGWMPLASVLR